MMKALLICPKPCAAVSALSEKLPLAALPLFGSSVVESWLVHLAGLGVRNVVIHASDRVDTIRAIAKNGIRWGLEVDVISVPPEQSDAEVCENNSKASRERSETADIIEVMDHLPNQSGSNMFASYANWFHAVINRLPHALTPDRVGIREIAPGIFSGHRSQIAHDATLTAPCWIGDHVVIGASVAIGPQAVIEDRSIIRPGSLIQRSIIGADTLVGHHTEIRDSLVSGERLTNWCSGFTMRVADVFLLASLRAVSTEQRERPAKTTLRPTHTSAPQSFAKPIHDATFTTVSQDNA